MEELKLQIWNYLAWLKDSGHVTFKASQYPESATDLTPSTVDPAPAPEPAPPPKKWADQQAVPAGVESKAKVLFLSLQPLLAEERLMVDRIAAALGLQTLDYRIEELPNLDKPRLSATLPAQAHVFLGQIPDDMRLSADGAVQIPHPRDMLREPALKKSAWDDLQKLKATLV